MSAAWVTSPSEVTAPTSGVTPAAVRRVGRPSAFTWASAAATRLRRTASRRSFATGATRPPARAVIAWSATLTRRTPGAPASASTLLSGTSARTADSAAYVPRTRPPTARTWAATALVLPSTVTPVRPALSVVTPVDTRPRPGAADSPRRCRASVSSRESIFFWVGVSERFAWASASICATVLADKPPDAVAGGAAAAGSASARLVTAPTASTSGRKGRIVVDPPAPCGYGRVPGAGTRLAARTAP